MAADDRAVRRELAKANRYDGKVVVDAARRSSKLAANAVIGGADVDQSPTVVVVDRNRKAVVLVGYVDAQRDQPGDRSTRAQLDRGRSRTPTSARSTRSARTSACAWTASTSPTRRAPRSSPRCAASSA